MGHELAHGGLEVVVADDPAGDARGTGPDAALIQDQDVLTIAKTPGPQFPASGNAYCRKFRLPVREYVIEVRFDSARLPARCQQYAVPAGEEGPSRRRNLTLDPSGSVHSVALGFGPGVFGIRWDWPSR